MDCSVFWFEPLDVAYQSIICISDEALDELEKK